MYARVAEKAGETRPFVVLSVVSLVFLPPEFNTGLTDIFLYVYVQFTVYFSAINWIIALWNID